MCHEISHAVLGHPPGPPLNDRGCGHFDKSFEEEANWLGCALLISEEAALYIMQEGIPMTEAVEMYGASEQLIRMRIGVSGAKNKVRRGFKYSHFGGPSRWYSGFPSPPPNIRPCYLCARNGAGA